MENRIGRIALLLVAVALVATACSSDGSGAAGSSDTSVVTEGVEVDDVAEAAATYTGELGDEGAFAAVLIALDRGYAVHQLVPAADLTADGTIEGTDPANQPGGLVDLQVVSDGGGVRADDEEVSMGPGLRIRLVSHGAAASAQDNDDEVDPREAALLGLDLTIGEAQREAAAGEYLEEMGFPEPSGDKLSGGSATVEGYRLVMAMMMLAARGYSAEQIVTALVTGTVEVDSGLPVCLRIPGEAPAIEVAGVAGCAVLRDGDDDDTASGGDTGDGRPEPRDNGAGGDDDTALESIPTGLYEGTIDTSTGGFRTGVSIDSAGITLQYANGGVLVDWTVSWIEDAGECTTAGTDSWSGSEVTLSDAGSFSIRGTRQFQPGADDTCEIAVPNSSSRVFRFEVDGTTVTSDIGLGTATIEIGG